LYIREFKKTTGASSGKRRAKRSVTVSVKTPNWTEEKAALKSTSGMAQLRGFVR
jgi:hypothetical protein